MSTSPPSPLPPPPFHIVHLLRRRVRIIAPILRHDHEHCTILEVLLNKHHAIRQIRTVPELGSVAIHIDPQLLPMPALFTLLTTLLGHLTTHRGKLFTPLPPDNTTTPTQHCTLTVEGMTCASCALLIEMRLRQDPRVQEARVNFASNSVEVRGNLDQTTITQLVNKLGYEAHPLNTLTQRRLMVTREQQRLIDSHRRLLTATLLAIPVMALGMAMPHSFLLKTLELLLTTPILLGPGLPIFTKAWQLARQGSANMDSLIALGAGAAYGYSLPAWLTGRHHLYFEAAAGIITFVLLGRYLEEKARGKASEAIRGLIDLQPATATRIRTDGQEERVAAETLAPGEHILIRPGERIAADGVVRAGRSTVDESLLTGESLAVVKETGTSVVGGCINGAGTLTVEVSAVGANTVLAGIIRLVEQAQNDKLPVQKMADAVAARFVPGVLGVAAATALYWLARHAPMGQALANAVSVLLIACPCALGLATPTAIMAGTGQAARQGIFIRHGESLENAARINVMVLDKTGTVTRGKPMVTDFHTLAPEKTLRLLALAASVEHASEHDLGRAVVAHAQGQGCDPLPVEAFHAEAGHGVTARVAGETVLLGHAAWLERHGVACAPLLPWVTALAGQGKTPILMAVAGRAVAVFGVADELRPDATAAVQRLRAMGIAVVMVTGDLAATAQRVAARAGIQHVAAQARPERKVAIVRRLRAAGYRVGMAGDGVNDAPALAAADVGFAMASGTDVAMEAAGMTLLGEGLGKLPEAVLLSRRTMSVVRQNLFWALIYNAVAIPEAAAGRLNPMIASAAMAMSSVSVVLSALRLQRHTPEVGS